MVVCDCFRTCFGCFVCGYFNFGVLLLCLLVLLLVYSCLWLLYIDLLRVVMHLSAGLVFGFLIFR